MKKYSANANAAIARAIVKSKKEAVCSPPAWFCGSLISLKKFSKKIAFHPWVSSAATRVKKSIERVGRIRNTRQAAITKESSYCFMAHAIVHPSRIGIPWDQISN